MNITNRQLVAGIDVGLTSDRTAFALAEVSTVEEEPGKKLLPYVDLVHLEVLPQATSVTEAAEHVTELLADAIDREPDMTIWAAVDGNGIGAGLTDILHANHRGRSRVHVGEILASSGNEAHDLEQKRGLYFRRSVPAHKLITDVSVMLKTTRADDSKHRRLRWPASDPAAKNLSADLAALEYQETTTGRVRVAAPRTAAGHCDLASAVALAVHVSGWKCRTRPSSLGGYPGSGGFSRAGSGRGAIQLPSHKLYR